MTFSDLFYRDVPSLASLLVVWETLKASYRRIKNLLPIRLALGVLCSNAVPCLIFVKHLHTPQYDNRYKFKQPDYFPPQTTGKEETAINIPSVIAKADTTAIGDLLNAMGQAGRHEAIEVVDPVTHWDKWDGSIACVGGSFKAHQVWNKCEPLPVVLDGGTFRVLPTGDRLVAENLQDFSLICKTKNPDNGRDVWLIVGLGAYGTEAAGYFLRTSLATLGKMFGSSCFAVVVRTTLTEGGRQASLWWYTPDVKWWRKVVFWPTYRRFKPRRQVPPGSGGHLVVGGTTSTSTVSDKVIGRTDD